MTSILQCLDKMSLDVTSLASLDSHINQPLLTGHGVEKVLLWSQSSQVGVLHEPSCFWAEIILCEVQYHLMMESKCYMVSFHTLLPDTHLTSERY